jgi:hypothetical protein
LIVGGYAVIYHAQPRFTKDIADADSIRKAAEAQLGQTPKQQGPD